MKWLWLALAGLLAVAAGATWFAFHDPVFWAGLVAAIAANLIPIVLKRMSPQDEAEWRELQKRGASKEEMLAWQRLRRRRKLQK